ncbi:MAG: AAA family ATPase [Clostridia bacterium]|nr:AAA family ATPase [Clostridia bacterium]
MRLLTVTATEFGLFRARTFSFDAGLTLIEGENESGKSTLQALLLFLLYGFPRRSQTERDLRLSREGHRAAGEMRFAANGTTYHLRRTYLLRSLSGRTAPLEECLVTDRDGNAIDLAGKQPGEYFLGVSRELYEACACVKQSEIETVTTAEAGDAVSNLLFLDAGGARLDTATRLLDAARRELQHNRGQGGLLAALAEEHAILSAEIRTASERTSKLHELKSRAAALTAALQDKEHELHTLELAKRASALDELLARFGALHEAEAEEIRLQTALSSEKSTLTPRPSAEQLAAIQEQASRFTILTSERDATQRLADDAAVRHAHITGNTLYQKIEGLGGADTLDKTLTRLTKRGKRLTLLLSLLLVAGFGTSMLLFTPIAQKPLLAAIGGAALLGAAVTLIRKIRTRKQRGAHCKALGLRTPQLLPTLFATHRTEKEQAIEALRTKTEQEARAAHLTAEITVIGQRLTQLAAAHGLTAGATPQALLQEAISLSTLQEATQTAQKAALQARLAAVQARRETLAESLQGFDEASLQAEQSQLGDTVPHLSADEIARRRTFAAEARAGLTAKLLEVSREEAALSAKETDLHTLQAALAENERKASEAADRLAAIQLAQAALGEADSALRGGILPRIMEKASLILRDLTEGKYDTLRLTADFTVSLAADGEFFPLATFSAGCRDAVGLSLRLALTELLASEPLPLLFDEVTARLDDVRAARLLRLFARLSAKGTQMLLFTCHRRETALLTADHIPFTKINLSAEGAARS